MRSVVSPVYPTRTSDMNLRTLAIGIVSLSLLAGAGAWVAAQPNGKAPSKAVVQGEDADEEVIDLARAPEPVRSRAVKVAGSEKAIKKVIKEEDGGVFTFEIEYTQDGVDCSAVLSAAGEVMELEKGVNESALPAAAMAALKKDFPNATFKDPNLVQKFYFEIDVVIDGKTHEVKVDAAGNIEDEHGDDGDEDDAD